VTRRPEPVEGGLRPAQWIVAGGCLAAGLFYAALASFAFGTYYLTDVGTGRLQEQSGSLALAGVSGVGTVAVFRGVTGKRISSPWLLAGLVPAAVGSLNHLGLIH
jgi:hypothetical protein